MQSVERQLDDLRTRLVAVEAALLQLPHVIEQADPSFPPGVLVDPAVLVEPAGLV